MFYPSLHRLADMFYGGEALIKKTFRAYPSTLPLLIYHGSEDKVTWHDASKQLVEDIAATDKTFKSYEGYFHEPHNEVGAFSVQENDVRLIQGICISSL